MLIPKFINLLFLDCNSKLTEKMRIRLSLAYIYNDHGRIQTGAITNTPGIIFALGTNEIRFFSEIYDDNVAIAKKSIKKVILNLRAICEAGGDFYIMSREDQIDGLVRLHVSSSTKKSRSSEIIKNLLVRQP